MHMLLAMLLAIMPPAKRDAAIREVHGQVELPHRLFLGDSHAVAFERLSKEHGCIYIPVRPRAFWIIECNAGKIRALGQYGIGLLQYEEYDSDPAAFIGTVCGGMNTALEAVDLFYWCRAGTVVQRQRSSTRETQ